MVVYVRLNALLRAYAADGSAERSLHVDEGCTVHDLIAQLDIPPARVGFATVNLKYAPRTQVLAGGDRVILFPPVTGG
jgi:sulfur carrier protein ThiS